MSIRATIPNALIGWGRRLGNSLGCEIAVELNDHSIQTEMVVPNKETRAWDSDLYRKGNVFVGSYANPIKPRVEYHEDLEDPDEITHVEGEPDTPPEGESETDGGEDVGHVQLISSPRYRDYMRQDLISQLLTPSEQWKLIMYAVLGNVVLTFFAIIVTLYATGSFA
jgi:hypothetical protein